MLEEAIVLENCPSTLADVLQSKSVQELLLSWYDLGKIVRWFLRVIIVVICTINPVQPILNENCFRIAIEKVEPNYHLQLLRSVSLREIVLLVAMLRWETRNQHYYSFEMVFDHNLKYILAEGGAASLTLSRSDAFTSFEHLIQIRLVTLVGNAFKLMGGTKQMLETDYQVVKLLVSPDVLKQEIRNGNLTCPTSIKVWAMRL